MSTAPALLAPFRPVKDSPGNRQGMTLIMANTFLPVSATSLRPHPAVPSPGQRRAACHTATMPAVGRTHDPEPRIGRRRRVPSPEQGTARQAVAREIRTGFPARACCGACAPRVRPPAETWACRTRDEIAAVAAGAAAAIRAGVTS